MLVLLVLQISKRLLDKHKSQTNYYTTIVKVVQLEKLQQVFI